MGNSAIRDIVMSMVINKKWRSARTSRSVSSIMVVVNMQTRMEEYSFVQPTLNPNQLVWGRMGIRPSGINYVTKSSVPAWETMPTLALEI